MTDDPTLSIELDAGSGIICAACGQPFVPRHGRQRYCKQICADRARQQRHRTGQKYRDTPPPVPSPPEYRDMAREPPRETPRTPLTAPSSYYDPVSGKDLPIINGRINGLFDTVEEFEAYQRGATLKPALDGKLVLRGDDYPLSYDADGNIEIPACLDRSYEP